MRYSNAAAEKRSEAEQMRYDILLGCALQDSIAGGGLQVSMNAIQALPERAPQEILNASQPRLAEVHPAKGHMEVDEDDIEGYNYEPRGESGDDDYVDEPEDQEQEDMDYEVRI